MDGFFEEDEPLADVLAAWDRGEKHQTQRPVRRPDPPPDRHEGYTFKAEPEGVDWRLHTRGMQCRFQGGGERIRCPHPAVADLMRGRYSGTTQGAVWWAYCPEHLYGRWVENGAVMHWILRPVTPPPDGWRVTYLNRRNDRVILVLAESEAEADKALRRAIKDDRWNDVRKETRTGGVWDPPWEE